MNDYNFQVRNSDKHPYVSYRYHFTFSLSLTQKYQSENLKHRIANEIHVWWALGQDSSLLYIKPAQTTETYTKLIQEMLYREISQEITLEGVS